MRLQEARIIPKRKMAGKLHARAAKGPPITVGLPRNDVTKATELTPHIEPTPITSIAFSSISSRPARMAVEPQDVQRFAKPGQARLASSRRVSACRNRFEIKLRFGASLRSLLRGFFRGLVCSARSGEDAGQGVIRLVTRVFVDRILTLQHRKRCCPRSRPHGRIVDREFVEERVGVGAREAFDKMHVRAGAREARLAFEIRRVNHQGITLPAAARISLPLANVPMRTPIQGDDAELVDHLVENRHVFRSLEQLNIVVVRAWSDWRSGV
jgi:hypothetical protein